MIIHCDISDINECADLSHRCEHGCTNTDGSYTCVCENGFELHSNGRSCNGNL